MKKKDSVEFQILKSDSLRRIEEKCGKEGVDIANTLFSMGEDNLDLGLVIMGLMLIFKPDEEVMKAFSIAMLKIKKRCPEEQYIILLALNEMIKPKLESLNIKEKQ